MLRSAERYPDDANGKFSPNEEERYRERNASGRVEMAFVASHCQMPAISDDDALVSAARRT